MGDNRMREIEGKTVHDPYPKPRRIWVPYPVVVGAGPSGLAVAACLKARGIPSLILERESCLASLWRLKTYDRLKLHLPRRFCQLPMMDFPEKFPENFPTKNEFVGYLEAYAESFGLRPVFGCRVVAVENDGGGMWRGEGAAEAGEVVVEYVCRWLVVATGENAEEVVPEMEGVEEFSGEVVHTSGYRNGEGYVGRKVCVVGCGNSGMEVSLDLCNHGAKPSLVVRDTVHILPREMLGSSTFALSMWLIKWFPVRIVDYFLLAISRLVLGDTGRFGLNRPNMGPLEIKGLLGKTPVLDVGTLDKIKKGDIKIRPAIRRLRHKSVEFIDGTIENFDAVILATGYKSNVPSWLKESKMFSEKDGLPKRPFPNGWKGENGLYAVGFTKRGLIGTSVDANNVANDIEISWKAENQHINSSISNWPLLLEKIV